MTDTLNSPTTDTQRRADGANIEGTAQAFVLAAGLGTRLRPLTDRVPKALVGVGGRPLLERVLDRLEGAGIGRVVVNVHHLASQIIDFVARHQRPGLEISISDESEALLDTGGGIKKAARFFAPDRPILIHNVDIMSNVDLGEFYARGSKADALLLVSERTTTRYLLFDASMRLVGWTNTATGEVRSPYPDLDVAACRRYAFAGIHVFSPRLFALMEAWPDRFSIVDFYLKACAEADIRGHLATDLRLLDVGKVDTLAQADAFARELDGNIGQ